MNYAEAVEIVKAARENGVFLMEAFMYRCHPQIQKLVELMQDAAIGKTHLVRATFGYQSEFDPTSRTYNHEMGGGSILDIGCYTASVVPLIAGAAEKKLFLDPATIKGSGNVRPTGVDHPAAATIQFENGIIAEIISAISTTLRVVYLSMARRA